MRAEPLLLRLGGRVVDADALELGQPDQGHPVVARPGGDDDRLRGDRIVIVEPDPVYAPTTPALL
jgi:hypothetical protein